MGEFVKFLPQVQSGSLGNVLRQGFYLPPLAVVVGIALLSGARQIAFPTWARVALPALALPVSVQVLPPAWSPTTLLTAEFRAQAIALAATWLVLAGFWLWGRLPVWLTGAVSAILATTALAIVAWQLWLVKPAIDQVYGRPPAVGWGFVVCEVGLAILSGACLALVLQGRTRRHRGR
jgi:hypothetical protein